MRIIEKIVEKNNRYKEKGRQTLTGCDNLHLSKTKEDRDREK